MANELPNWMSYALYQAPELSHWRISLRLTESGPDTDPVVTNDVAFLPLTDESGVVWTGKHLAAKRTWSHNQEYFDTMRGMCNVETQYELLGFELVEL